MRIMIRLYVKNYSYQDYALTGKSKEELRIIFKNKTHSNGLVLSEENGDLLEMINNIVRKVTHC